MDLTGAISIVTGGTKGIGFAIAETLLRNGAKVMVCGRDKRGLNQAVEWLSQFGRAKGK